MRNNSEEKQNRKIQNKTVGKEEKKGRKGNNFSFLRRWRVEMLHCFPRLLAFQTCQT
jgi:hypothetical protein